MTALSTRDLTVRFTAGRRTLTAVDGVDLQVPSGAVLGLVGESGSGKSTLARALVGLVPVSRGQVLLDGQDAGQAHGRGRRALRRRVQMIFQDPYASLNPRMTVGETLAEAAAAHRPLGRRQRADEVARLLDLVALDSGHAARLPRELSGGQRQRVAIARALAVEPQVLIADEITSALDVSVQGAILNLVRDIQTRLGLTVLFISHNLAVVRYVSDLVAVMYLGRIVEAGPADQLLADPRHPYTRTLLDAVPRLGAPPDVTQGGIQGAAQAMPEPLDEDPPDPHEPPAGCRFHPRCPVGPLVYPDRAVCAVIDPQHDAADRPHRAACHFAGVPAGPDTGGTGEGTQRPASRTST